MVDRQFVAHIHRTGFAHISLGFHIDFESPNIEIHLPFCFIRLGWQGYDIVDLTTEEKRKAYRKMMKRRSIGITRKEKHEQSDY